MHTHIKTTVTIFDTVFYRAEYWRFRFGEQDRSEFYKDAIQHYINFLSKEYPALAKNELAFDSLCRVQGKTLQQAMAELKISEDSNILGGKKI